MNLIHRIKYNIERKRFARSIGLSISNFAKEDSISGNTISAEKLVGILSWIKETCTFYPEYNKKVVNVNLGSLRPPSDPPFDKIPPLLYQKTGNGIFRTLLSHEILHILKDYDIWKTAGDFNLQWYDAIVKLTALFLSYYDDTIIINKIEETNYIFILGEINSDERLYYSLIPPSKDEFIFKEDGSDISSMSEKEFYKDIKLNILDVKEIKIIENFSKQQEIIQKYERQEKKNIEKNIALFESTVESLIKGGIRTKDIQSIEKGLKNVKYVKLDEMHMHYTRLKSMPKSNVPTSIRNQFNDCLETLKYFSNDLKERQIQPKDEKVGKSTKKEKYEEAPPDLELLKKAARRAQKPETALDELCAILIKFYRTLGTQNNCAPSSKTSDEEIVEIYSRVATAFKNAAKKRGEEIPAPIINRIALCFFQVKEQWGNKMYDAHLDYEIKLYIESGLRSDYQKGLSIP